MLRIQKQNITIGAFVLLQLVLISQAIQADQSTRVENPNSGTKRNETNTMEQTSSQIQTQTQRGRSGRMMDLDHLVGAIGKDEKVAKERSMNGNRQSRILSEDILPVGSGSVKSEARSKKTSGKKSGAKKMAIKGFIPILSLEGHKGGNPLVEDESDNEEESGEENSGQTSSGPDQLLQGYGSQTSMGHASFVGAASEANPQQQQHQHQHQLGQPQWQHLNGQLDQPEAAARARKLLHGSSNMGGGGGGSLLGSLSAGPKRLISTLVPGQQQQQPFGSAQLLQSPMNMPQYQQWSMDQSNGGECICVPFFQCRNGYLNANQLSKGQLQQISAASSSPFMVQQSLAIPQHHQQYQEQHQHQSQHQYMHQVPRALKSANDLYYNNQATTIMNNQQYDQSQAHLGPVTQAAGLSPSQPDDQQAMNDAYEQLKKTMESENIEQLLLQQQQQQQQQQQMMNLPLLDERSKAGNQQMEPASAGNGSTTLGESQERSLLNPLAGRRSGQQKSCGIMRTCCKISPNVMGGGLNRGPQAPRLLQQQDYQPQHKAQQFQPRPQNLPMVQQGQGFQSQFQQPADFQSATSALIPSVHNQFQQQQQQSLVSRPPPISHPMGSFMAGRCGTRQALGVAGRVQNVQPAPGSETTAEFGEFPSHAAILKRISPGDSLFVCSAVLISNQWLATAAHCIKRHRPEELKVRLGEWDVQRDDEFYPFVELNVRDIIVHPDFQPSSLINDIALMRLESSLDPQQMPHIAPACLAAPDEMFARSRCWLTGWGKDAFGQAGAFQSILKKVDLPVMERGQCESALRYQTKLGKFFRLHQSALCAGGERGKDACEGDGGSGLYCTDPESGLTKVIGLVSWGVGCGQVGVPGVYTNLGLFYPWIEGIISSSGEENLYMDRNSVAAGGNSIPDNVFKSLVSERSNQAAAVGSNGTLSLQPDASGSSFNSSTSSSSVSEEDSQPKVGEEVESRAGRRRR